MCNPTRNAMDGYYLETLPKSSTTTGFMPLELVARATLPVNTLQVIVPYDATTNQMNWPGHFKSQISSTYSRFMQQELVTSV